MSNLLFPTIEKVMLDVHGSCVFRKLDLKTEVPPVRT